MIGEAGVLSWGPRSPPGNWAPPGASLRRSLRPIRLQQRSPRPDRPCPRGGAQRPPRPPPAGTVRCCVFPGYGRTTAPPHRAARLHTAPLRRSRSRHLGRRTHLSSARRGGAVAVRRRGDGGGGSTLGKLSGGGAGSSHMRRRALGPTGFARRKDGGRRGAARTGREVRPREAALAHPVADQREDQLRLEASFMQSPFIGVSDSCSIRHTKREN